MPRYFFHSADHQRDRDTTGVELADHAAARIEAVRFAGCVLTDEPRVLEEGDQFRIEVTDEAQHLLFTVVTLTINAPVVGAPVANS
ncbi:MAG TPA: hypothetical protein VF638_11345 [Sphingomonas sp.]|jgi:hypothetical protein